MQYLRAGATAALCVSLFGCGGGGAKSSTAPTPTPSAPPAPTRVQITPGCYSSSYQNAARDLFGCGLLESFGSTEFDKRFSEESTMQDEFFQKVVLVGIFDECLGVRNAVSHPAGFILFGRNLALDVVIRTSSAAGVSGILAHEYAHQKQFDFGWSRPWEDTVRNTELEADAFSGFYMGLSKGFGTSIVRAYFETLANTGDYQFNSPGHHGTPQNRVGAGLLGLLVADEIIRTKARPTWADLHTFFIDFIVSNQIRADMASANATSAPLLTTPEGRANLERWQKGLDPEIPTREIRPGQLRHLFPR